MPTQRTLCNPSNRGNSEEARNPRAALLDALCHVLRSASDRDGGIPTTRSRELPYASWVGFRLPSGFVQILCVEEIQNLTCLRSIAARSLAVSCKTATRVAVCECRLTFPGAVESSLDYTEVARIIE